jgi:ubiquinone/menaquinone biosynthesis C-methylase UbiE
MNLWNKALLWSLALIVACAGCRTATLERKQAPPQAKSNETAVAPTKESVKPGINDPFQQPDLDVSKWVERFEGEGREIYAERERIVEAVGLKPEAVIADVGAGTGLFTGLFARAIGPAGKVYAVDIAPDFLEHIAERVKTEGIENVATVLCKEDSVELAPDSIDIVFICDTYHHFEYPKSTMASIHTALRTGGKLVIIDFERDEDTSSAWILKHVRAGRAKVIEEISAAGFEIVSDAPTVAALKQNYFLTFRKRD